MSFLDVSLLRKHEHTANLAVEFTISMSPSYIDGTVKKLNTPVPTLERTKRQLKNVVLAITTVLCHEARVLNVVVLSNRQSNIFRTYRR